MTDSEINRIHAAVDDFASAMKTRLTQKVEEGYYGWDDEDGCPSQSLRQAMLQDAVIVHDTHNDEKTVDIANRAMMLWYRANKEVRDGTGRAPDHPANKEVRDGTGRAPDHPANKEVRDG